MGTNNCATNMDMKRISDMATGKLARNSPEPPFIKMMNGKKVILIAIVADRILLKKCWQLAIEAWNRDMPLARFSK